MDLNDFLAADWLRGESDDSQINQSREEIGAHWGWGADWYSSDGETAELFGFLNDETPLHTGDGRTRAMLLDELDGAADESQRASWLSTVEREVFWSVPENRYAAPEYSEPYGMSYRYDRLWEFYEWEDPAQPGIWISQEEADALVTAREQEQPAADTGYCEPVWDENWQMLYRVGPDGVYEYAHSDDHVSVRPGTGWLSYEEATQQAPSAQTSEPTALTGEPATFDAATSDSVTDEAATDDAAGAAESVARTKEEAAAGVVDIGLRGLRQVGEQAPEIARLLAELPDEEVDRLLGQAMAEGALAAGVQAGG